MTWTMYFNMLLNIGLLVLLATLLTNMPAIRKTAERGIRIGAHLIFGLPGESRESMLEGAVRLSG